MRTTEPGNPGPHSFRVSEAERSDLLRLAQILDRTPSQVIRRALRFYRDHTDTVEQALRQIGDQR